ncbi:lytic polysaccharide monooxygenase auxiliary activity family 9 protein [Streptosporangium subroseum]|uniref:lytic polysaccharide monooxygenase auxiliary activity family 9 protein n=1 Tax=Streptosporangium subroseum TaxID=106412 RepID=UPI00344471A0
MLSRAHRAALAAAAAITISFTLVPAHAEPSPQYGVARSVTPPSLDLRLRQGYVSSPKSRQAACAARYVSCGLAYTQPQSVKGVKNLRTCSGNNPAYRELDDETKPWPATKVKSNIVTFNWILTAAYRTSTWDYYIGNTRIARFDSQGAVPTSPVAHTVDLGGRTGRLKVLAVWNIADTNDAYYSCVDLQR